jgi:hypothetical protein
MEPTPLNLSVESKLETETGNLRSRLVSGVGEPEPEQPLEAMQTGGTNGQLKSADPALTPAGDDYATVQSTRPSSPSVSIEVPHVRTTQHPVATSNPIALRRWRQIH